MKKTIKHSVFISEKGNTLDYTKLEKISEMSTNIGEWLKFANSNPDYLSVQVRLINDSSRMMFQILIESEKEEMIKSIIASYMDTVGLPDEFISVPNSSGGGTMTRGTQRVSL